MGVDAGRCGCLVQERRRVLPVQKLRDRIHVLERVGYVRCSGGSSRRVTLHCVLHYFRGVALSAAVNIVNISHRRS